MKKIIGVIIVLTVFFGLSINAMAADNFTLTYSPTNIHVQKVNESYYLFLPSSAELTNLKFDFGKQSAVISYKGKSIVAQNNQFFNLKQLFETESANGIYTVTVDSTPVNIMKSNNIAAVYLKSEDSTKDRIWVEKNKNNKAKGSMKMINANGKVVYDGALSQIKGRGNSTWNYAKKPYQIKLGKPTDLMETGNSNEANSTWLLLANYKDMSLLKNQVTFSLARKMGFPYTPNDRQVDLYYDGEYRGVYQMTEKTEVGKGRVDIDNLEKRIQVANPNIINFEELTEIRTINSLGNKCQYIDGIKDTSDMTGGYLLEMDFYVRALEEKSWFMTSRGQSMVCKAPEYLNKNGMEYISKLYQQFENAVYNGGVDISSGKDYRDIVDVNSLAKYYIIEELSQDIDAFCSSTFLYKEPGLDQKLYYGPVWDFDMGYGFYWDNNSDDVTGLGAAKTEICKELLSIPSFQETVKNMFNMYKSSIYSTAAEISKSTSQLASAIKMNSVLWPENTNDNGSSEQALLKKFIENRAQYLDEEISSWDGSPVMNVQFFDVSDTAWYSCDIEYVVLNGIFTGSNTGYFFPKDSMTRAMSVQILYNMYNCPSVTGTINFKDISAGSWCRTAVTWAVINGVAKGTTDKLFSPDDLVTRQDFMTMLYRCWGNNEDCKLNTKAPDANRIKDYALKPMAWAIENGLITGDDNGYLRPRDTITRSEAAAIVHRCADQIRYIRSINR